MSRPRTTSRRRTVSNAPLAYLMSLDDETLEKLVDVLIAVADARQGDLDLEEDDSAEDNGDRENDRCDDEPDDDPEDDDPAEWGGEAFGEMRGFISPRNTLIETVPGPAIPVFHRRAGR